MSRRALALLGAALWTLATIHGLEAGVGGTDDVWSLRVAERITDGDVLYRDVFFGTTPLSVWLETGLITAFGSELITVKLLVGAALAACGVAAAAIVSALGASRRAAIVLATIVVVWPGAPAQSPYSLLAAALALLALAALLRSGPRAELVAGILAGLAAASKHTTGALCLLALAVGALALERTSPIRRLGRIAAGAAGAFVAVMVPVVVTGGLPRFVEYAVTAKGTYVAAAGVSYPGQARAFPGILRTALDSPHLSTIEAALTQSGYVALPLAAVLLALATVRATPSRRGPLAALLAALLAASATLYPRADPFHMVIVLPVVWVAGTIAVRELWRNRILLHVAFALAVVLAGATVVVPAAQLANGSRVLSSVPHLRGALLTPGREADLHAQSRLLRAAGKRHRALLMLGWYAPLGETLGDLESPTPFGYPLITAFGRNGLDRTVSDVRAGRFGGACISVSPPGLAAVPLERAVRATMRAGPDLGLCRLFTAPPHPLNATGDVSRPAAAAGSSGARSRRSTRR